jgi:hypothetical protein
MILWERLRAKAIAYLRMSPFVIAVIEHKKNRHASRYILYPWARGRPSNLCGRPRRGPNFQLFLNRQLRPILGLPKEEFAVPFIIGPGRVPLSLAGAF